MAEATTHNFSVKIPTKRKVSWAAYMSLFLCMFLLGFPLALDITPEKGLGSIASGLFLVLMSLTVMLAASRAPFKTQLTGNILQTTSLRGHKTFDLTTVQRQKVVFAFSYKWSIRGEYALQLTDAQGKTIVVSFWAIPAEQRTQFAKTLRPYLSKLPKSRAVDYLLFNNGAF